MESTIFFKTKNNNYYLFDNYNEVLLRIHPLIEYFYNLEKDGIDLKNLAEYISTDPIKKKKYNKFCKEEVNYQLKKYYYLKQYNFFSNVNQFIQLNGKISSNSIQQNLVNLNQILFEVTHACNLNCYYCGYGELYSKYDKRENKNINSNNAKIFLEYLAGLWESFSGRSIKRDLSISFYGGEPLLNMAFVKDIVYYIKDLHFKNVFLGYSMTTNAVLLDKYMDFLAENKFKLLISLDGNEGNNNFRVFKNNTQSFKKVFSNAKLLQKRYPEYFEKYVDFNAVLHSKNSVSDIYNFVKKEFNKKPQISALNIFGIKKEKKHEFIKTYKNVLTSLNSAEDCAVIAKDMYLELPHYEQLLRTIQSYSTFVYRDYNDFLKNRSNNHFFPTSTCLPFSKKLYFTVNNKILPCEKIPHCFVLGKIENGKVELDFNEIANKYNGYFNNIKEKCSTCYNYRACPTCLFNLDNLEVKPYCKKYQNVDEFRDFFSEQLSYLEDNPGDYIAMMEEVIIG